MTRLADALQRANLKSHPAPDARPVTAPDVRTVTAPDARTVTAAPGVRTVTAPPPRSDRKPMARVPRAAEALPMPAGSTLIGLPVGQDQLTTWRTDPELIGKVLGTDGFSSAALEQYRKLAATLHHAQDENGIKVIMMTSALPGEGKSLTAANLALTLSESYHRRVFLVDADLRRPTVQRIFGLPPIGGLNEGLKGDEDRPMAVTRVSDRLFVLPAGRPESDPMSGLTSDRMRRFIAQASSMFDWVIIDTPPVGLLPDASLLASCVDGVLLVVRAGKAPYQLVKRTVDAIKHERILGVVMNAVDFAHDRNAGGYYEYYGAGYYGTPARK